MQEEEQERRRVGRPAGKESPEKIWREELLQVVKLSRKERLFAEERLQALQEAAGGADNIKTKIELAKVSVELMAALSKVAANLQSSMEKEPQAAGGEGGFDLEKFLGDV